MKKKTSKVVRYNHSSEAQVRRPIAASFQSWIPQPQMRSAFAVITKFCIDIKLNGHQ